MRRTKEDAEQTRQNIFKAGVRVFSEKGYAACTLNDIARRAGITRGAIYWHYKSKGEFFGEILGRVSSYYDELVTEAFENDLPFTDMLRSVVVKLLHRFVEDREWRAMQELVIRSALNNDQLAPFRYHVRTSPRNQELLTAAVAAGQIHGNWDANTAMICVSSVLLGVFLQVRDRDIGLSDTQIEQIADFVVRGFSPAQQE